MVALLAVLLAACGPGDTADPTSTPPTTHPTTTPSPVSTRAVGPPPRIPWWSAGRLHLSEGVIRTPLNRIVARGGTTIVGRTTETGSRWLILRGDDLAELVSTQEDGVRPVLSANGRFAAWTTSVVTHRYSEFEAETEFTVSAYHVGRGAVTGTTVIDSRTECCDGGGAIDIAGVDNDGSVIITRYADRAWVWRPGREPIEVTDQIRPDRLPGDDQWPGGMSWTTTGDSIGPAVFARVSATGVVTPLGRVPQTQGGLWSPDGRSFAYPPYDDVRQTRPVVWRDGHRQVLLAPRGSWPLAWESDRRVLLVDGDLDVSIQLVRCWVGDGRCEQAGPPLRYAQVPDPFVF